MSHPRRRRLVGVTALLAIVAFVGVAPVVGGTGLGAVFNLGRTNTVNSVSTLTGSTTSRMLQVTNKGTGAALQLTTRTTAPPLKVNSSVKVANLNADKLDGIDSTGFIRPTGQILVSAGNSQWVPFTSTDPVSNTSFSSTVQWQRSGVGANFLSISPDLPVAMYGKVLELQGVEFCYGTTLDTTLAYVEINTVSSSNGEGARNLRFSDATAYTDDACHLYTLASPAPLGSETGANFFVQVNWTTATGIFSINRTTFVLGATDTAAAAPAAVRITGQPVKAGARSATEAPAK